MMDISDHATTIAFMLRDRDSRFARAFDGSSPPTAFRS
jgi:hypothetical protein